MAERRVVPSEFPVSLLCPSRSSKGRIRSARISRSAESVTSEADAPQAASCAILLGWCNGFALTASSIADMTLSVAV
jgi:hypothetical protein